MVSRDELERRASLEAFGLISGKLTVEDAEASRALAALQQKKPPPTANEAVEQRKIIRWCAEREIVYPELRYIYHCPNEGRGRSARQQAALVLEGLKKGVPDLHLPAPKGGYHGLWIELKAGRNKPTPEQLDFLAAMRRFGHYACWCIGADAAIKVIEDYLNERI